MKLVCIACGAFDNKLGAFVGCHSDDYDDNGNRSASRHKLIPTILISNGADDCASDGDRANGADGCEVSAEKGKKMNTKNRINQPFGHRK